MKESLLQKKVKQAIHERYHNCWYYHPSDTVTRGIPDILLIVEGKFFAIELKKSIKLYNATALQKYNLLKIKKSGGFALISESIEEVMNFIENNLEKSKGL